MLSTNRILEIKDIKCCFSIYTQQKLELRKDDFSAHQVAAYRAELTDPEAPEYLTVSGNFLTLLRASLGSIKLISNLVCLFGARWQAEPARSPREGAGTARLQRRDRAQQGSRVGNRPGTALPRTESSLTPALLTAMLFARFLRLKLLFSCSPSPRTTVCVHLWIKFSASCTCPLVHPKILC